MSNKLTVYVAIRHPDLIDGENVFILRYPAGARISGVWTPVIFVNQSFAGITLMDYNGEKTKYPLDQNIFRREVSDKFRAIIESIP